MSTFSGVPACQPEPFPSTTFTDLLPVFNDHHPVASNHLSAQLRLTMWRDSTGAWTPTTFSTNLASCDGIRAAHIMELVQRILEREPRNRVNNEGLQQLAGCSRGIYTGYSSLLLSTSRCTHQPISYPPQSNKTDLELFSHSPSPMQEKHSPCRTGRRAGSGPCTLQTPPPSLRPAVCVGRVNKRQQQVG